MPVELHAASAFSFLRASSLPEDLVERAARLGYTAVALVDRDGLSGAPRFFKAARASGLRPIVGAALSLDGGGALPLLVETQRGYRNLCRLITRMKAGVPKGEGRLRLEMLEGLAEGLFALPGVETLGGTSVRAGGRPALETDRLARLVEAFGPGRVVLDVQRHRRREQEALNHALLDLARDAEAAFAFPKADAAKCTELFTAVKKECDVEYSKTDSGLTLSLAAESAGKDLKALNPKDTTKLVQLMMALPHGPIQMTPGNEEFVETSLNLGVGELTEDGLHLTTSERSMSMSRLAEINRRVEAIGALAGAEVKAIVGYPSWPPNMDSAVLRTAVASYEDLFKQKPKVELVHAGLECGVIGANAGGMDMLALGPTIKDVHSPSEKLNIPSLERVWKLLVELTGRLAK